MIDPQTSKSADGIAVYCGSSLGRHKAYSNAARSVGHALAHDKFTLVYGGGSHGLMGVVSTAALERGGDVTGIVPHAIHVGGGERGKLGDSGSIQEGFGSIGHEKMKTIVVNSMHERKVEMAKRSAGFIGLPGGFGTFEEILEVTTWTQLGIHNKPVVLLNVLGFFEPLRQLIKKGVTEEYITPLNEGLIVFVDGPESLHEQEDYNWGNAGLKAVKEWRKDSVTQFFDWTQELDGTNTTGKEEAA